MGQSAIEQLAEDQGGLNPLHMMVASGARGSKTQIRQLVAIRGLMAMPDGRIMSDPLATNFIQGLSPFEYLASVFGARKGLSDTALKTADAGFLFKRMMNAVQDVMVVEDDCGATEGVLKEAHPGGEHEWFPLHERLAGRTALEDIVLPGEDRPIVKAGETIGDGAAVAIEEAGHLAIAIRSPVTCRSQRGVCAKCYGLDLAHVAHQKGISTSFGAYGDGFDGMLEYKEGRFHIFCNLDRIGSPDSTRSRFTMAHELGHYYIDGHRNVLASGDIPPHLSRCEFESSQLAEQEADHFAGSFLMPP